MDAQVVISQVDALRTGQKFYFTGVPCKRGHRSRRYSMSDGCVQCVREGYSKKSGTLPRTKQWPDDGGVKRVTTVNPASGIAHKIGWTRCLSPVKKAPHRFFSHDVLSQRVCPSRKYALAQPHRYF